jgi:Serine dehydrogenase proteinase
LTDTNVRYCFWWGLAVSPCLAGQEALHANHSPENLHGATSPAASLIAVVDKKPIAKIDDRFYCPISDARPSRRLSGRQASFLTRQLSADQANNALAETLTSGIWTHDYPIWASTAKSLGLPVNTNMPDRGFSC